MNFVSSHYINYTTRVVVEHLGKEFEGFAYLHPDDMDRASEYVGGDIAETRATIKALKYERKLLKEKCEECRKFVKACNGYKNFDKDSPTAKVVFRQLNRRIKEVNDLTDEINELYKSIDKFLWKRDLILNTFKAKKDKRD